MEMIQNFLQTLTRMKWSDYVDIIVVAFLIYKMLPMIHSPSIMRIARTVVALILVTWITDEMQLHTLNWILSQFLAVGLLAFIILFQPELRQMLFHVVGTKWFGGSKPVQEMERIIYNTVEACTIMSIGKKAIEQKKNTPKGKPAEPAVEENEKEKAKDSSGVGTLILFEPDAPVNEWIQKGAPQNFEISVKKKEGDNKEYAQTKDMLMDGKVGALIVFERKVPLKEWIDCGTPMNCDITAKTLCSIFYPVSPLHDGAVIIRNGRIAAAGCKLPLTKNEQYTKKFGTRHCAAVGITEASDAISVVVSEERGEISYAIDHKLVKCFDSKQRSADEMLEQFLRQELLPKEDADEMKDLSKILRKLVRQAKENIRDET